MDDPFISCPYDIKHRVPRSRIQAHIVKCQKNHPTYSICPYNATHRFPTQNALKEHTSQCPSKAQLFPENYIPPKTGCLTTPKSILEKHYLPETDPNHEMWDK